VFEAESQVVLNTLTEHSFQNAFKEWQKRWERCICAEGSYFEGDGGWPVGPKLVFDQMESPILEIVDGYLYIS
jgi:hypothetical protein